MKFDKELGPKSDKRVQAIFAVDDATAQKVRATFVLDISLIRSFGRKKGDTQLGLSDKQQEFLAGLALWKIQKLLELPFRFRSGCHLRRTTLQSGGKDVEIDVDIKEAIKAASFPSGVTDVFWPRQELYREGKQGDGSDSGASDENEGPEETE